MENNLGTFINKIRNSHNISMRKLAEQSGVSQGYLSKLENNKVVASPDILKKLSDALDIPYKDLLITAGYLDDDEIIQTELPSPKSILNKADYIQIHSNLVDYQKLYKSQEKNFTFDDILFLINLKTEEELKEILSVKFSDNLHPAFFVTLYIQLQNTSIEKLANKLSIPTAVLAERIYSYSDDVLNISKLENLLNLNNLSLWHRTYFKKNTLRIPLITHVNEINFLEQIELENLINSDTVLHINGSILKKESLEKALMLLKYEVANYDDY